MLSSGALSSTQLADPNSREALLLQLDSSSSHDRLAAARALSSIVTPTDGPRIRSAYARETVSFVRRSLSQTLSRLEASPEPEAAADAQPPTPIFEDKAAYWKAVDWVTGTLLHEIHPRLGAIEWEARKGTTDYRTSALGLAIDSLKDLLQGIEDLRSVTTSATLKEFNLARRLKSCASTLGSDLKYQLIFDGREDLIAVGDPSLLAIAFCNGLRNAIEASTIVREAPVVVVAWGETDVDFWVNIVDQGPGIGINSEAAFNLGATSKRGHRGFGLAIARQAMLTMDGSISLRPNGDEGSTFELRWFK